MSEICKFFFVNLGSWTPPWVVGVRKGGNELPFISTSHRKEVKQWKHLLSDEPLKHSSIASQKKSSSEL